MAALFRFRRCRFLNHVRMSAFIRCINGTAKAKLALGMPLHELDAKATGLSFGERYQQRNAETGSVVLNVGDYSTHSNHFTADKIHTFGEITTNKNPLHDINDNSVAIKTGFKDTINPGMFTASLFSAAIGAHFPGSIALDMNIRCDNPVYVNDYVDSVVTVNKVLKKGLVKLNLTAKNQNKDQVMSGTVTIMVKNLDDGRKPRNT